MKELNLEGGQQKNKDNAWENLSKVEKIGNDYKINSRYVRHEILKQLGEGMVHVADAFEDEQTALNAKGTQLHVTDRVHVAVPLDEKYTLKINFSLKEIQDFDLNLSDRLTTFIEGGYLEEKGSEHEAGNKVSIAVEGDDLIIKNNGAF